MEPLFCVSARTFIRVDAHVPISVTDRSELRKEAKLSKKTFFLNNVNDDYVLVIG